MKKKAALYSLANVLALFLASQLFRGVSINNSFILILAGIVLALVNLLMRPVFLILTLPFNLVTLGLFVLIVNTWMVMLTALFIPGFSIHGFIPAFLTSIIVSLLNGAAKKSLQAS